MPKGDGGRVEAPIGKGELKGVAHDEPDSGGRTQPGRILPCPHRHHLPDQGPAPRREGRDGCGRPRWPDRTSPWATSRRRRVRKNRMRETAALRQATSLRRLSSRLRKS